jgi:hypothetical protein
MDEPQDPVLACCSIAGAGARPEAPSHPFNFKYCHYWLNQGCRDWWHQHTSVHTRPTGVATTVGAFLVPPHLILSLCVISADNAHS